MATIRVKTYPAEPAPGAVDGVQIEVMGSARKPFTFEATKVAEIQAELDRYRVKLEATGECLAISASVISGRKPTGFKNLPAFIGINGASH